MLLNAGLPVARDQTVEDFPLTQQFPLHPQVVDHRTLGLEDFLLRFTKPGLQVFERGLRRFVAPSGLFPGLSQQSAQGIFDGPHGRLVLDDARVA